MPTLIHLISATTWGGGERYALDVCRHFRSRDWHVLALTRDVVAVDRPFELEGVRVRHLPLRGYADLVSPLRLASMLRARTDGTVLHVHKYKDAFTAIVARMLARRRDVKVVLTRHLVKRGKRGLLARFIMRRLDAQIFVSRLARDRFVSAWPSGRLPFQQQRMHILHNSIFNPQEPYSPPPVKGPRIVLFLGRLSPEKGLETLLSSLHVLRGRRARLWICGTGQADYVDSLKRLATRLGVMDLIDWKGYVDNPQAAIAACHLAVLPSVAEESFGLANAEVMAAGRVQICTSHGAQSEYLADHRTALFIPPSDAEALARSLLTLLDDTTHPPLLESMGRAAYTAYAATLSWPRFAARLEAIYGI